jgi:pimeloyl-ACP methyl ester carboxylesterase
LWLVTPVSHRVRAGIELVVHDWGGDGAPILLAHPTGFHGRVWAPVAEQLVDAGSHVWSFDFRGHGDSGAPTVAEHAYSWHGFAEDVLDVVQRLGLDDALACGHSKGGAAVLLAEALVPGTFARIWTYEPIVFPREEPAPPTEDNFLSESARRRRNIWPSIDDAYTAYASKPPLNVMTADSLRAYVEYGLRERADGTFELKCRPEVEAQVYAMAPGNGVWSAAPRIEPPVVVACGEHSPDVGPPLATLLADRLPHGRLEVQAGLGHFGPQQDPAAIAASILAFGE